MKIKYIELNWNENFSIFSSEKYLKSISSEYGWLGGSIGGKIKFVLPFVIKHKLFFRWAQFSNEAIYFDNLLGLKEENNFLNSIINFLRDKNIDFIQQPPANAVFNTYPNNSLYTPFGSYYLDLGQSENQIWLNLHKKHRNAIRRAINGNIRIEIDKKNIDIAYRLIKGTMQRSQKPFHSKKQFYRIAESLGKNVEVILAFYNQKPQGCAIFPFSRYAAYYLYGGSIEKPFPGSLNLLHWQAIKYFRYLGVKYYDFMGARVKVERKSKLEGIQRFKIRFGAKIRKGYLWKVSYNRFRYNLWKFLFFLRTKEKEDIIDQKKQ